MSSPTGNEAGADRQRLFLALAPAEEEKQRLREAVKPFLPDGEARWARQENLHMTLIFFGAIDSAVRRCIETAVAGIRTSGFDLMLDRFGYRPRSRMLWAMPTETPAALVQLVGNLRSALQLQCRIMPESRPFTAHVTLGRQVKRPPKSSRFTPVTWSIRQITLMESVSTTSGTRYLERLAWPLS